MYIKKIINYHKINILNKMTSSDLNQPEARKFKLKNVTHLKSFYSSLVYQYTSQEQTVNYILRDLSRSPAKTWW